ncbi:hypothetical protein JEQ12_001552 [Ovis aries]|uniref:Uncharacterized protein n=1 Tax=Ovis aries TaxID=9940 RepID=A0A836D7K4_SHEEP|nr:hypothetical protein JEQ12_001552 [Ovis aries]
MDLFHREKTPGVASLHDTARKCWHKSRGTIVRSTARVIEAVVFSHHFLSEDPFFQELIQAINFGLAFVCTVWCWLNDLFPCSFHCLPGPYQDMFRYQKVVRGYTHREISRHKLRTSEALKDFISCYLAQIIKATDNPVSTFNEENLIQVVVGLFLGGTNTTATTLYWVFINMIQRGAIQDKGADGYTLLTAPGLWASGLKALAPVTGFELPAERVQQELDAVLGTSGAICYKDHKLLPHTCAILHELNPGHFLNKEGNFVVRKVFLPFSAGHQVCLGDQLAQMKLLLMFATLLGTFSF